MKTIEQRKNCLLTKKTLIEVNVIDIQRRSEIIIEKAINNPTETNVFQAELCTTIINWVFEQIDNTLNQVEKIVR